MTTVNENVIAKAVPTCREVVFEAAAGPVRRFERVLKVIEPFGLRNPLNSASLRHMQSCVANFKRSRHRSCGADEATR